VIDFQVYIILTISPRDYTWMRSRESTWKR